MGKLHVHLDTMANFLGNNMNIRLTGHVHWGVRWCTGRVIHVVSSARLRLSPGFESHYSPWFSVEG